MANIAENKDPNKGAGEIRNQIYTDMWENFPKVAQLMLDREKVTKLQKVLETKTIDELAAELAEPSPDKDAAHRATPESTNDFERMVAAGEFIQDHPQLFQALQSKEKREELESLVDGDALIQRSRANYKKLAEATEELDRLTQLQRQIELLKDSLPGDGKSNQFFQFVKNYPTVGSADWTLAEFPEAKAWFCQIIIVANEMEQVLRNLVVHYNYMGLESESINELLSQVNDFCNILRSLADVQRKRRKIMAKIYPLSTLEASPRPFVA